MSNRGRQALYLSLRATYACPGLVAHVVDAEGMESPITDHRLWFQDGNLTQYLREAIGSRSLQRAFRGYDV